MGNFCSKDSIEDYETIDESEFELDLNNPKVFIDWIFENRDLLSLYKKIGNTYYYFFDDVYIKYLSKGGKEDKEEFRKQSKIYSQYSSNITYHYSTEKNSVFKTDKFVKTGFSYKENFDNCFKNDVKGNIIGLIEKSEEIVGCTAWIKDKDLSEALNRKNSKVIVNNDKQQNKFIVFRKYEKGRIINYAVLTGSLDFPKKSVYIEDEIIADKYYKVYKNIWDDLKK